MGHSVSFGNLKFDELIAAAFGKLAGELPSGATPGDVIVYTTNLFISKSATPVFKRAADRLNRTTKGFSSGMSYDDLAELDLLLEDSFNLITDEGGLGRRTPRRQVAAHRRRPEEEDPARRLPRPRQAPGRGHGTAP